MQYARGLGIARRGWCVAVLLIAIQAPLAGQQPTAPSSIAGLRIRADRAAGEQFHEALESAVGKQLPRALHWLETAPIEELIPGEHGAISRRMAVDVLLNALSVEGRQTFLADFERRAEQAWRAWELNPQTEHLQTYCLEFGPSLAGLRGWKQLAIRLRDDQRWWLAEAAWRQIAAHPGASVADRTLAANGIKEATQWASAQQPGHHLSIASKPQPPHQNAASSQIVASNEEPFNGATRPAANATWSVPHPFPQALRTVWQEWRNELEAHGQHLWPMARPLVFKDRVYYRNPLSVVCRDLITGRLIWQVSLDDWAGLERIPGGLDSLVFRQSIAEHFGRHLMADSLMPGLSSDGRCLFLLQEGKRSAEQMTSEFNWPASRGRATAKEPHNFLAAYHLQDGSLAWRIGGRAEGETYPFANMHFCGHPLVVDDLLYVIAQRETELQLLAIRADRGELAWKLVLGDTPRPLSSDPARQRIGCVPVWYEGALYCPTAAGAIVCVDPLTRSIRWAARYPIAAPAELPRARDENTTFLQDPWWEGWREVQLSARGDTLLLATPESDQLLTLELSQGRLLWAIPRGEGRCVFNEAEAGILVQEIDAVRLHDHETGQQRWRRFLGPTTGRGHVIDRHNWLVPTRNRGLAQISIPDGVITWDDLPHRLTDDDEIGTITQISNGWIVTSFRTLSYWQDLSAEATLLAGKRDSLEQETILAMARHALATRQIKEAQSLLERLPDTETKELQQWCRGAALRREPGLWKDAYADLLAIDSSFEKLDLEASILLEHLEAARQAGDVTDAVELALVALSRASRQGAITLTDPSRKVRPDLAIAGAIQDLLTLGASDPKKHHGDGSRPSQAIISQIPQDVEALLAASWARAKEGDPFALPRLAESWKSLRFSDRFLTDAGTAAFLGQSQLALELRLLTGTTSPDAETAGKMKSLLTQQLRASGFTQEADDYERWWQAAGHRGAMTADSRPVSPSRWSSSKPEVEQVRERNDGVHYFPVPFDVESSPYFDRLDLHVERQGRRVRFGGGGHAGTWDVPLPASPSSYRYLQQYVAAWGRGRVVVLRVGFELFGLTPIDERGEPATRVLWHLDMLNGTPIAPDRLRMKIEPQRPGIRDEQFEVLNAYHQTVGQVGPVRPGYLCYREKGRLVCIDLWSGLLRWMRDDLPGQVLLTGDDDVIVQWEPARRRVTAIRPLDGATILERTCDIPEDNVLLTAGRNVWWIERIGDRRRFRCDDLATDEPLWQMDLPAEVQVCLLDENHWVLIRPSGVLEFLQSRTGKPLTTIEMSGVPPVIDRTIVARDADHWYLALSERLPQQVAMQQIQLRNGYRAPFITGPLLAIQRHSLQKLWQIHLEKQPFSWDQPKDPPVLMQRYKVPQSSGPIGQLTDGVIRLIDKQTGETVFEAQRQEISGYGHLSADALNDVVTLALERETVRLRYRNPSEQPDPVQKVP